MFKKIFVILILIGLYISYMSLNKNDTIYEKIQDGYAYIIHKLEKMGFEVHVNKWVYDKKKKKMITHHSKSPF